MDQKPAFIPAPPPPHPLKIKVYKPLSIGIVHMTPLSDFPFHHLLGASAGIPAYIGAASIPAVAFLIVGAYVYYKRKRRALAVEEERDKEVVASPAHASRDAWREDGDEIAALDNKERSRVRVGSISQADRSQDRGIDSNFDQEEIELENCRDNQSWIKTASRQVDAPLYSITKLNSAQRGLLEGLGVNDEEVKVSFQTIHTFNFSLMPTV